MASLNGALGEILSFLREFLEYPLYKTEKFTLTLGVIMAALVFIIASFLVGSLVRRLLIIPILRRTHLSQPVQYAVSRVGGYTVTILFLIVAAQTMGIDFTALAFMAGAIGIGIGFGLQNIISNFISGLIILFERPIKLGDRVDLGDLAGTVIHISARSTIIRTNDNINVIVPNSEFVTSRVINWSYGTPEVRFRIPISVAYGSDIPKVEKLLLEVAKDHANILTEPTPQVFFNAFGESSLDFELAVWNSDMASSPRAFRSRLNFAIEKKFRENGIVIPFPQRDLHIRSGSLPSGKENQDS